MPSAWIDPRPWLLAYFTTYAGGTKWMEEEYKVMFAADKHPWDAGVQDVIRQSRTPLRTDLFDQEYTYLSDCAMYVDFVVHRAYVEFTSTDKHPVEAIQKLGRFIDMFERHIRDMRESTEHFRTLTVESAQEFAKRFSFAWYNLAPPTAVRTPCWETLNVDAEATLCRSIQRVVLSYDAPTPAQEEHSPLITLFRKAWPQKHQLDQFVKKFIRVVGTVEQRRMSRWNEERRIERYPTGDDVMRHILQWWCMFHIGGYRHSKVVVTHPEVRLSMCSLWNQIPKMGTQELTVWSEALARQPVVTLCVVKEFMLHAIEMNSAVSQWLCARSKWPVFREMLIEYADAYRKTLPYMPVPVDISAEAQEELDFNRAQLKQSEKTGREKKRSQRMLKQAVNANKRLDRHQKLQKKTNGAVQEASLRLVRTRLTIQGILNDASSDEEEYDDANDAAGGGGGGERKRRVLKRPKERVDLNAEQFRVGLYDEGKDYDDTKNDVFDEQFIRDMNKVTNNPALTQLHIFVRCIHEVGASTRIPASFWAFVYNQMPITQLPGLDLKARTLLFNPTSSTFAAGTAAARVMESKGLLNIDLMMARMRTDIDQQWWMASRPGTIGGLGEDAAMLEAVEPSLRPQFLGVRRCFQLTMIAMLCNPEAIEEVAWLISMYFQHSRCGKPTITYVFNRLIRNFPYEYNVVYCLMMAWKQWSEAWRVPLPVEVTELQLTQLQALFPEGVRPDFRIDWLLYCPSCKKIPSLVDQSSSTGSSYPKHYKAKSIAGFSGIFVDVRDQPESESQRKIYCPRKTGRAAQQCAQTCLRHMKMAGYLCILNDAVYVICPQVGCGNKMQYNPETDGFNRFGWMCSACVQSSEMRQAMDHKVEYAEARFETVRTRNVTLPNGRTCLDVVSVANPYPDPNDPDENYEGADDETAYAHRTDVDRSIVGVPRWQMRNAGRHEARQRGSLAVADPESNKLTKEARFFEMVSRTNKYLN